MMTSILIPIVIALAGGLGILIFAMGVVGVEKDDRPKNRAGMANTNFNFAKWKLVAYPALVMGLVHVMIGWPTLTIGAGIVAAFVPRSQAQQREQVEHFQMTEDLATWVQQVRDAIVSGSGLEAPLRMTAKTGPERLRPKLATLAANLNTMQTVDALNLFAADVKHHIADMLVSSYQIAARESTAGLPDLMTAIATTAETEVETFRGVEVSRKKVKSSVRMILGMLGFMAGGLLLFARDFLRYYDSPQGQAMLLVVVVMVVGSYIWIQKLNIVRRPPRFFALEDGTDKDVKDFQKKLVKAEAKAQDADKEAVKAAAVPRSVPASAPMNGGPAMPPPAPAPAPPTVPSSSQSSFQTYTSPKEA